MNNDNVKAEFRLTEAPTSQRTNEITAVCPENRQNLNSLCENMEAVMLMRWYCTSGRIRVKFQRLRETVKKTRVDPFT